MWSLIIPFYPCLTQVITRSKKSLITILIKYFYNTRVFRSRNNALYQWIIVSRVCCYLFYRHVQDFYQNKTFAQFRKIAQILQKMHNTVNMRENVLLFNANLCFNFVKQLIACWEGISFFYDNPDWVSQMYLLAKGNIHKHKYNLRMNTENLKPCRENVHFQRFNICKYEIIENIY